jgi:hypothetical protein
MPVILLVEKNGNLKTLKVKELKEEELYKKCSFKNSNNFGKQHTWKIKHSGKTYFISLYAKTDSRVADCENKYEFPPPVASCLYFGTCLLVGSIHKNGSSDKEYIDLTIELWKTIYEKLHGGFETLANTESEDEREPDPLKHISSKHKTKEGYLKDGFVVDSAIGYDDCDEDLEEPYESESEVSNTEIDGEEEEEIGYVSRIKNKSSTKRKKKANKQEQSENIVMYVSEELIEEDYL